VRAPRGGRTADGTPAPPRRGGDDALPAVVRRLTDTGPDRDQDLRTRLMLRLSALLAASARHAGAAAVTTGRWLTDLVVDIAPHIPVRDLETLRRHHDGLAGDQLADALIERAAHVTAGVGAALGVIATTEWSLPAALLSAPVQIAAETVAVVAVELKLVAELHEVYGRTPPGTPGVRAAAYLSSWSRRRGIDPIATSGLMGEVVSSAAKRQLRTRIIRRTGSSSATLLPFFAGAIAGATLNSKNTKRLGRLVAADLARRNRP